VDAVGRRATDRDGGATKRSLLAVSRSLESLAEHTAELAEPLTVVALFEEAAYFAYERERYARLAESATVIVGSSGRATSLLPERVLRDELLANWWRTITNGARLEQAEQLALTDPLTGAYNRRFLDGYLQRLGPRAPQLAVLAFDLDGFKGLNDTYGHAVSDAGLRAFADLMRGTVRSTDVLVRLGGDEWLLVMPAVTASQALERAGAIVEGTAAIRFEPPAQDGRLRVSVGVGVFPAAALDLEAADAALHRAKRVGGGRVEVAATATGAPATA
jgi:diguanylate cyclase (GGDEF)-like protein